MREELKVAAAEARVEESRDRMLATMNEIMAALEPKKIVRDAWETAKVKGADLAEDAVDAVRKRPVAAGGVVAALALFLARDPIKDLASKLFDRRETDDQDRTAASDNTTIPKPAKAPARRRPARRAPRAAKTKTETE